mmetsp:Transcript_19587/g.21265  ORF Transcript_19587/g.21265 Transcript_19587/m.21265 type:complete len:417 (-) Transcript_19587:132-1382(-)|eukprot:CAMPEP_0173148426 /NCGR_PEP_ID=MMETSP1105-20130129/9706_1 /TAXON_ID=2985 /ORGANISM="Ochromonas sp., Strain BG-1" /LENGTH=416 /DNA_ID=CAMNT_0014063065 /DNA_START=77 /DNA_END=1327 /DNA_ORIENTATION=+
MLVLFLVLSIAVICLSDPVSVSVKVINYAGEPVELFWINTFTREVEYVPQTKKPIRNSTEAVINSYETHQFEIRLLRDDPEATVTFTKGPEDETVIVRYDEDEGRLVLEQVTDLNKLFKYVEEEISKCYNDYDKESEALSNCVSEAVLSEVRRLERTKGVMKYYQSLMGQQLRDYSCQDPKLNHSSTSKNLRLKFLGESFNAGVYLDTDQAKIYAIDDFITTEECSILRQNGRPIPNMSSHPSLTVNYNIQSREDPLWNLFSRSVYFANYIGKYNIRLGGQDGIVLSKYTVGEEIKSHCDGLCNGEQFNKGDYVTTVLFDCSQPISGGDIIFAEANVFIPAETGQAIFITYKGENGKMDEGYSKYSTCPVTQGERFLARLMLREGTPLIHARPSTRTSPSPNSESFDSSAHENEEL